jgi:hypothetical protein
MISPSTDLASSPATEEAAEAEEEIEEAEVEEEEEEEDADARHSSSSGARTRVSSAISSAKVDGEYAVRCGVAFSEVPGNGDWLDETRPAKERERERERERESGSASKV